MRRFVNVVITGKQERILPVYVHVTKDHLRWFSENEVTILNNIAYALCDHIALIQHAYHQQHNSTQHSMEDLHHIHGGSINISYAIRRNNTHYDNVLLYTSDDVNTAPDTISDPTSHLRAIVNSNDVHAFPRDFNSRCSFIITGEKGTCRPATPITYGSFIRLKHKITHFTLVALHQEDDLDNGSCYNTVALRSTLSKHEETTSTWQVLPRYQIRKEGDPVESDDFIVLRNSLFKDKYLTSIPPPTSCHNPDAQNHLIGLRREESLHKQGWKIRVLSHFNTLKHTMSQDEGEDGCEKKAITNHSVAIEGGMFVRLTHVESNGQLIARYDDSASITAKMAPLGRFCHQVLADPCHQIGIYVRGQSATTDPNSASSIWQILPVQLNKLEPCYNGDSIRFRHVLTGQYLCVRAVDHDRDSVSIRTQSMFKAGNAKLRDIVGDMAVATTSEADYSTLFQILNYKAVGDESNAIKDKSDVFFLHEDTQCILAVATKTNSIEHEMKEEIEVTEEELKFKCEDYAEDNIIRPSRYDNSVTIPKEVYRIIPVPETEVADVLYVSKFLPIIKSAIVTVQHTKKMSELFLPLFRHLNVATHTLVMWVMNQNDCDNALLLHPALTFDDGSGDNHVNKATCSTSSLGPWIGRGTPMFQKSAIAKPIRSCRNPAFTEFNIKRQNIVSDSRILDLLIFFTTVVFRLLKDQVLHLDEKSNDSTAKVNMYQVPSLVTGTCILVHDLVHSVVSENRRNSVRVLSVQGSLLAIMDQEILGWNPPIDTLLIALQSKKRGTVQNASSFDLTMVLDGQHIHNLIKKTYELYMTNNESAVNLIKLLTTVCSPGHTPNPVFQSLILNSIFSTALHDSKQNDKEEEEEEKEEEDNESRREHILGLADEDERNKAVDSDDDSEYDEDDVEGDDYGVEYDSNGSYDVDVRAQYHFGNGKKKYKVVDSDDDSEYDDDDEEEEDDVESGDNGVHSNNNENDSGDDDDTDSDDFDSSSFAICNTTELFRLSSGGQGAKCEFKYVDESTSLASMLSFSDYPSTIDDVPLEQQQQDSSLLRAQRNSNTPDEIKHEPIKDILNTNSTNGQNVENDDRRISNWELLMPFTSGKLCDKDIPSISESGETNGEGQESYIFHSLFFSIRKVIGEDWQVKFKNPFKIVSFYVEPDVIKRSIMEEIRSLKALITPKGRDGRMVKTEVINFLTVLGLGGYSLYSESMLLEYADLEKVMEWYWMNRAHYFPSAHSSLNEMSYLQVKHLVMDEVQVTDTPGQKETGSSFEGIRTENLTPHEEYCEFRNNILAKVPLFDIGSFKELNIGNDEQNDNYGCVIKKSLSVFLLYSSKVALSKMKKQSNQHRNILPWESLNQVLSCGTFESDWLRQSIALMAELCRGENLQAQTFVNQLFPAPMVLDMLKFGGEKSVKLAIITLLQNVYVVHDLVFPVSATCDVTRHGSGGKNSGRSRIICSLHENDSSISFNDAGKLFNAATRGQLMNDSGSLSSKALRKKLWCCLAVEFEDINLKPSVNEVSPYHTSLLRLIQELICIGFFEESVEFEADERLEKFNANNVEVPNTEHEKKPFFSCFNDIVTKGVIFNEKYIRKVLIKKITAMIEDLNETNAVHTSVLSNLCKLEVSGKISKDEYESIVDRMLKNKNPLSVGPNHINLVKDYFSEFFSNSIQISLVQEVISILDLIFDSEQLRSVKKVLKLLDKAENIFTPSVFRGHATVERYPISLSGVKSKIRDIFSSSSRKAALYTDSVLTLTLFNSDKVKSCAYDLLYKNVSKKINGCQVLNNLLIHVSPRKAASLCLFKQYQYVARKYAHQMITETVSSLFDYEMYITFAMNSIKSLCHHTFHERPTSSILKIKRPGTISFVSGQLLEVPLISMIKNINVHDNGIDLPFIMCASALRDKKNSVSLLGVTAKVSHYFITPIQDEASDVCRDVIAVFTEDINSWAITSDGECKWSALSKNQQFFVNAMLDVCAAMCVDRPNFVTDLLVNVSKVAISFMWDSAGAIRVVELFCEYCHVSTLVDEDLFFIQIGKLFTSVTRFDLLNTSLIRLLHAILASKINLEFFEGFHGLIDEYLSRNRSLRKYILLDMPELTDDDIEYHFQIWRLLATFSIMYKESILQQTKTDFLTVKYCTQLLSRCYPLHIKVCIITFCETIYNASELALLPYITMDLRNILETVDRKVPTATSSPTTHHLNSIFHPLLDYLSTVARVVVDTAIASFSLAPADVENVKISVDTMMRDHSVRSMLKPKKIFVLPHIKRNVIDLFDTEIDSVKLAQFFDCVLPLYNIITSSKLENFRHLLVSKKSHLDNVLKVFTVGYLLMMGLTTSKAAVSYTKETMLHQEREINPNEVIKNHLEAAMLTLSRQREQYEYDQCRENFLLSKGIQLYTQQVSLFLIDSSHYSSKGSGQFTNMESFTQHLDYSHDFSSMFIQRTTLFQVLQKHLVHASNFLENGDNLLVEEATDFAKVFMGMRSGSYFRELATFMQNSRHPTHVAFFFLHILCELLENNIDEIRASDMTTKSKIQLIRIEVERLQRFQDTFDSLGITDLVFAIVSRSVDDSIDDPFVLEFVPLALKVGCALLVSGNKSVQDSFMASYKSDHASHVVGSHKKHFMEALRKILRGITAEVDIFTKLINDGKHANEENKFSIQYFKLLIKIYKFCGSLCSGHNEAARNFLRNQDNVGEPIDIVFDIAKAMNSVLVMLVSQMRYITFDPFYELLAPPVWPSYPDKKRRFIKWHDPRVNFDFVCQILAVASSGFNALTELSQGPCFKNQPSALTATPYCQELLEYVGAMQLRTKTMKSDSKSFGSSNVVDWDGRHPLAFNKTYKRELKKMGRYEDDPDCTIIDEKIKSLSENSIPTKEFNARHKLLTQIAQAAEQSCLRFLMALLEATSPLVSDTLLVQLNDGILLQNMENHYKLSFESQGKLKVFRSEVTVSYLAMISIMASTMRDNPNALLDEFLLQWKQDNAAQGYNTEKLIASIEVLSQDGCVQRVYFAIPTFVTTYWSYPEVQKAKDRFLWAVSRESPEDKLSDFYDRSEGLIQVMHRQQALRRILTPPVHGIFGGLNGFAEKVPFAQNFEMQSIFLMMSLCFNVANTYWQYRMQYPWIIEQEYSFFRDLLAIKGRDTFILYLYSIHFGLAMALFFRAFLNSPAADNNRIMNIFGLRNPIDIFVNSISKLTLILLDTWWPMCLMAFSAGGIFFNPYFFAPILLDLINQNRLMSFLLEAITRNLGRIAYTLLLAIVFLYLFAVITIVGFKDQYALAGKHACSDLISCFKLQIDYGLVNPPEWVGDGYIDPYIDANIESTSYGHMSSIIAGSVFNFSYIILINLVLQAIISGLIIDTFSEMRAESEEIEVDIREKCFICSINRDDFEQLDISFTQHVKSEHNMWHYIWFFIYLESKDPLYYTGPEQYLFENLTDKKGFVRLGPIRKSLSIELRAGNNKENATLKTVMDLIRETKVIASDINSKVEKFTKDNQKSG